MSPKSSGISTGAPGPQSPSQANKTLAMSDAVLKNKDYKDVRASEDTHQKGSSDENVTSSPTKIEDDVEITALHSPKREETELTPISAMAQYTCAGSSLRTVSPPAAVKIKTEPEETAQHISAERPSAAMVIKTEPEEEYMQSRSTSPDDRFEYQSIIHTPAIKQEEEAGVYPDDLDEWKQAGKPRCPICRKTHPPPCDPAVHARKQAARVDAKSKSAEAVGVDPKPSTDGASKKRKAEEEPQGQDGSRNAAVSGKRSRREGASKRKSGGQFHRECGNYHAGECIVPFCANCRNRHWPAIPCEAAIITLRHKLAATGRTYQEKYPPLLETALAGLLPGPQREEVQQQQQRQMAPAAAVSHQAHVVPASGFQLQSPMERAIDFYNRIETSQQMDFFVAAIGTDFFRSQHQPDPQQDSRSGASRPRRRRRRGGRVPAQDQDSAVQRPAETGDPEP